MGRIITRDDGKSFHVGGRLVPKTPHRLMLHAPKYGLNLASWPATPDATHFGDAPEAQACLTDVLRNNELGCCTEADQFHRQALRQAAAGAPVFHPTRDQLTAIYSRDGGYVEGKPDTDQGCDETVVLGNHATLGIPCGVTADSPPGVLLDKPAGFLVVDATNRDLVRAVASTFVGASICMSLPDAILQTSTAAGSRWKLSPGGVYAPNPANGHCYTLGDQQDAFLPIWSWGERYEADYDFLAAGCSAANGGALYIEVDSDILAAASKAAPDGLDWQALIADFNDAGGTTLTGDCTDPNAPPLS